MNGWDTSGENAHGYLGMKFDDGAGTVNYGWAEITLDQAGQNQTIELHAYAYETETDTAIKTGAIPEPSTLGILALGAVGLAAWRRRQKMAGRD